MAFDHYIVRLFVLGSLRLGSHSRHFTPLHVHSRCPKSKNECYYLPVDGLSRLARTDRTSKAQSSNQLHSEFCLTVTVP